MQRSLRPCGDPSQLLICSELDLFQKHKKAHSCLICNPKPQQWCLMMCPHTVGPVGVRISVLAVALSYKQRQNLNIAVHCDRWIDEKTDELWQGFIC